MRRLSLLPTGSSTLAFLVIGSAALFNRGRIHFNFEVWNLLNTEYYHVYSHPLGEVSIRWYRLTTGDIIFTVCNFIRHLGSALENLMILCSDSAHGGVQSTNCMTVTVTLLRWDYGVRRALCRYRSFGPSLERGLLLEEARGSIKR